MNVLFLASEVAPFSKTGGLGDVAGALPTALAARGHQVTVVSPLYSAVKDARIRRLDARLSLKFPFGEVPTAFHEASGGKNLRFLFVDQPEFFQRPGLYQAEDEPYPDNHRRYAAFSMGALSAAQLFSLEPQVVHLNDWQTGLAAVALQQGYGSSHLSKAAAVFTIHNLAYQGDFPKTVVEDLGLPWALFHPDGIAHHDRMSFLKAGLAFSRAWTTVSPTYAKEIQTPEGGAGLDGFLRQHPERLTGILNGVDYAEWDPSTDALIPARYTAKDLSNKRLCKVELLKRFGLAPPDKERTPVFGVVSRLVEQKGIELIVQAAPFLASQRGVLALLGSGEARYEQALKALAARYPKQIAVKIGFDTQLAHLVEAGSDFFLMPSLYEPCGLNQMYSLRYGTVPVVRATGGLEDTVVDLSQPKSTGIKLTEHAPAALAGALRRALELYADDKKLAEVRRRGMACDFGWAVAAKSYEALYASLTGSAKA